MVRVQLLGRFAVYTSHGEITFSSIKVRQLAAYLFWRQGEWVERNLLRGLLWGDTDEKRAAGSLRIALHYLRQTLKGSDIVHDVLEVRRDAIRALVTPDIDVDAKVFEKRAKEALGKPEDAKHLIAATSVYKGSFLEGMDGEWCLIERQRLARIQVELLRTMVGESTSNGLYQTAISFAHNWLDSDPLDEEAYRTLMRLYSMIGQPSRAMEQFERCRQMLEVEFGYYPSRETIFLCEELGLSVRDENGNSLDEGEVWRKSGQSKSKRLDSMKRLSDDPLRNASLLLVYGEDKVLQGNVEEGMQALRKALSIYIRLNKKEGQARTRLTIGGALLQAPMEPQPREALRYIEPALAHYREEGPSANLCRALLLAANAYWETGQYDKAAALAQEGLELASATNDKGSEVWLSLILGAVRRDQYRLKESRAAFENVLQSLTRFTETKDVLKIMFERSLLALLMAELPVAESLLKEMLKITGIITPSPNVEQLKFAVRANLSYLYLLKGAVGQAKALCPPPNVGKYSTSHLGLLPALIISAIDNKPATRELAEWAHVNVSSLPYTYVEPVTQLISEHTLLAGTAKDALRWTAAGVRFARAQGWPGWEAVFYSRRSVALARQGNTKAAKVCRQRAERLADEADRWTLAWLAWADGLIARNESDETTSEKHLVRSVTLFNDIGIKHHRRHVQADMKRLAGTSEL